MAMQCEITEDPRAIWERRYHKMRAANVRPYADPWLARWLPKLAHKAAWPVLELGCGSGQDTTWLVAHGFRVIASDYCQSALATARQIAPSARLIQMDLRDGLPFPQYTFNIIVAGLCLHYFTDAQTRRILAGLQARLLPGDYMLARFNSVNDANYGAIGNHEVEPGCYIVRGMLKHFFAREGIERLFTEGWCIHSLEEMTIHRYQQPKVVWEVVVEKTKEFP